MIAGITINFDPTDYAGMEKIIKQYGGIKYAFFGRNDNDEDVIISVNKDSISTITLQKNGWIRTNRYTDNFDGTWMLEEEYQKDIEERK